MMIIRIIGIIFNVTAVGMACYQLFTQTFELQIPMFLCLAIGNLMIGILQLKEKKHINAWSALTVSIAMFVMAIIYIIS